MDTLFITYCNIFEMTNLIMKGAYVNLEILKMTLGLSFMRKIIMRLSQREFFFPDFQFVISNGNS